MNQAIETPAIRDIRGIYRDEIVGPDGGLLSDSGWKPNTIVRNCRVLLALCLKGAHDPVRLELSVGQGREEWDSAEPGKAGETVADLEDRYAGAVAWEDLKIDYLDNGTQSENPAPALQITATLPPNFPPPIEGLDSYPLREFGIFGVVNQQGTPVRYMVNCIRHPVIHKNAAATLIRKVRIFL